MSGRFRLGGDTGSMFVEAIISAAIAALAVGGALQVISDSAARERALDARRTALLVAQTELASVGADIPLANAETSGLAGNLVWRVDVQRLSGGGEANSSGALWRVNVSVHPRSGGPNLVTLDTLRLAPGT